MAFCFALLLCTPGLDADQPAFMPEYSRVDIQLKDSYTTIISQDLNDDGAPDLILPGKDRLDIYHYKQGIGFSTGPDQRVTLGFDSILFNYRDVLPHEGREIIYMNPRGVWALTQEQGRFNRDPLLLTRERPDFLPPSPAVLESFNDILRDLDGDDDLDLVLPKENAILILYNDGKGGFGDTLKLEFPMGVEVSKSSITGRFQAQFNLDTWYGGVQYIDYTSDGRSDLIYLDEKEIRVFPAGDDGRFKPKEAFSIRYPGEKSALGFINRMPITILDLDKDGEPDMVNILGGDGIIKFYKGVKDQRVYELPDQILREKGWIYYVSWNDMDNDGREDICMLMSKPVNFQSVLRGFLAQTAEVMYKIYLNESTPGKIKFSLRPNFNTRIIQPLSLELSYGSIGVETISFGNFKNDFDGDGHLDFFAMLDKEQVGLFLSKNADNDEPLPKTPSLSCTILDTTPYKSLDYICRDWNRDGILDFIIQYKNVPGLNDGISLHLSKKK